MVCASVSSSERSDCGWTVVLRAAPLSMQATHRPRSTRFPNSPRPITWQSTGYRGGGGGKTGATGMLISSVTARWSCVHPPRRSI
jgi:hypothetical protein